MHDLAALDVVCDGVPELFEDAPTARMLPFANRHSAGRVLGRALSHHARAKTIVLGVGASGLGVAEGVARVLELELDICIVQRLRAAGPAKAVVGVVAEGGSAMLSREALARSSIGPDEARSLASGANDVIVAIRRRYLTVRPALDVCGKTAILVDEGAATSTTLVAAIAGLRRRGARDIVVAVPVATQAALAAIKSRASEIICLATLPRLRRIGAWYHDHRQISDGHVMKILGGGSQPS